MALFHHGFKPVMIDDKGVCYDETTKKLSLMLKTVDIYEALTTDRPYHRGISNEEAIKTILNNDSYDKETLNIINECHTKFE